MKDGMSNFNMKYVIVTPVRDEEKYFQKTYESVISQTVLPEEWVIVNDGSRDRTGEIIDGYDKAHSWIKAVHRENRGYRKPGAGVVEAFYEGYGVLNEKDFDYIVKLDGDLNFDSDYFEKCFRQFESDPKLGIGGGMIYHQVDGGYELEENPRFHVRGATKIYRRACWEAIGGIKRVTGWDTIDEVKANMLGWETRSFPDLKLIQLRKTGMANGPWGNSVKNGMANYISGYHPGYMLVKCLKRIFMKPYIVDSMGHFYGFLKGYLSGVPQVDDREMILYLRRQQIRKMTFRDSVLK
jgi:glycosyltransferase involved in cell wall biosynthesis